MNIHCLFTFLLFVFTVFCANFAFPQNNAVNNPLRGGFGFDETVVDSKQAANNCSGCHNVPAPDERKVVLAAPGLRLYGSKPA